MKRISALLILGIGLLSSSCTTRQARQVLDHAEALIGNDCPDSALVVLTAFDTTDLHSRESKARYALLHTMALYKGFHDDDLTLYSIEPAARWYSRHGCADERFLTLYYQGIIHHLKGDIAKAACSFMDAEAFEYNVENKHELSLMFLAFASLYLKTYNTQMGVSYTQRALDILADTGDPLYQRALGDLAMAYHSARQWQEADSLYRIAIDANMQVNPRAAQEYMLNYAAMKVLEPEKDPRGSIDLVDQLRKESGYVLSPYFAAVYAYALVLDERKTEARAYLKALENMDIKDDAGINNLLFKLYKSEEDYKMSLKYLSDSVNAQAGAVESALTDSISIALQNHFREKEDQKARRLSLLKGILLILAAAASVVTSIAYYRSRLNKMEIARLLSLLEANDIEDVKIDLIEEKVRSMARETAITDMLWLNQNNRLSDKELLSRLRDRFSSIKSLYDDLGKLESRLDKKLDGVIGHIKTDLNIPDGADELRFICYTVMQLRPDMMSELLGITINSVYVKKSRLKKQLLSLDSEHKEEYRVLFKDR